MFGGQRGKYLVQLAIDRRLVSKSNENEPKTVAVEESGLESIESGIISGKQCSSYVNNNIEEMVDAGLIFEDGSYYAELRKLENNDITSNNETRIDLFNNVVPGSPSTNSTVTIRKLNTSLVDCSDNVTSYSRGLEIASDSDYVPESESGNEESSQEDSDQESVQNVEERDDEELIELREQTVENATPEVGKRRKRAEPDNWKRNASKIKRMKGEAYLGYTRTRSGEVSQNQQRPARSPWLGCSSKECLKSNKRHCNSFTKEHLETLFSKFWKLSWEEKKVYVCSLIDYTEKQRSYTKNPSRRSGSFIYHLKKDDGKFIVCKKMFLGTLGLKEKMVHSWIKKSQLGIVESTSRTGNNTILRKSTTRTAFLKKFFESLPKQPAHYCRKDTSKVYLEQSFRSKAQLYECYKERCQQDNVEPYTVFPFNNMFDDMKLSIFNPRKDECDTCHSYSINQISEEEYRSHILNKDKARDEKTKDKEEAVQNLNYTFTMDTQAVKLCPVLNVSAAYYKTKLQVHNFTIFNLATHQCSNYLWDETEGDLSASVFVTSIIRHLEDNCLKEKRRIILYSDGCGYQNRNNILANALLHFAVKHNVEIEQKYLEKGHTQMECDSVHALIERKLKRRLIHLPSEYISIILEARQNPMPLDVFHLHHGQFLNFDDKATFVYNSIRPGKRANDPTVANLRVIKYSPEGKIFYKLSFDDDFRELDQRAKECNKNKFTTKPLFKETENKIFEMATLATVETISAARHP